MMNSSNEGDWMSELPESILHHILSFLDLKPAIQTSILSTKWRYVWKSLPFLNFDEDRFYRFKKTKRAYDFDVFVDNVLNLRDSSSSIERFRLNSYKERGIDQSDIGKRLSRWITTAVESNVEDMNLHIIGGVQFQLPLCIFSCKSLRKLELILYGYVLINLPDSMNLPRLKTLILFGAEFEGNDDIPNKIISSCPVLESLEFECCDFCQPILDINAPQLKQLVFRHCERLGYDEKIDSNKYIVKLNAPKLVSFRCEDDMFNDYSLENVPALVKAGIIMGNPIYDEDGNSNFDDEIKEVFEQRMFEILRVLHKVEDLTLSDWFIEVVSGVPDLLKSKSIEFCNLRCLKLAAWLSRDCVNAITHLLNISPNLESLFLQVKEDIIEKHQIHPFFDKVRFDLAKTEGDWEVGALLHLKFVTIQGVRGCLSELQFLEILLKNGMVLEKLIIELSTSRERPSREFVEQLLTLPRTSPSIEFSVA